MTPFEQIVQSLGDKMAERLERADKALALGPKPRSRIHLEATAALYRDLLAVIAKHHEANHAGQAAPIAPDAPNEPAGPLPEVPNAVAPAVRRSLRALRTAEFASFRDGPERDT